MGGFWCIIVLMHTIVIIEDDTMISHMYRMKFESEGFRTEMANNGKEGIALVTSLQPDIILLDLEMPKMNGAEALQHIRNNQETANTPVIILTNLDESEAPHEELAQYNVVDYIVKVKMTPREVVAKVKDVLQSTNS